MCLFYGINKSSASTGVHVAPCVRGADLNTKRIRTKPGNQVTAK